MVKDFHKILRITLKRQVDESYDIVFGQDLFSKIAADLKKHPLGSVYAIITDSNTMAHGHRLMKALLTKGIKSSLFSFKAGERQKTLKTCTEIMNKMSQKNMGRDCAILALGGGVVGDMAGFIATIFNRGIPLVHIPTTVLAQADSAIGGKTGVDTTYGKNLVGAFKQPAKVYIDISLLKSLPLKEIRNGLAETIKHAVIKDKAFFHYLEKNIAKIIKRSPQELLYISMANCRIKAEVVQHDPYEQGMRRILNYGHTIGHALELVSKFSLTHGEAVSIGMMAEARIAHLLGYFSHQDLEAQEALLIAAGLPTLIPNHLSDESIIELTTRDKKAMKGQARYALPARIGKMMEFNGSYATLVDHHIVLEALQQTR